MSGIAMAESIFWQIHEVAAVECRRALFRIGRLHSASQRSFCSLPGRSPLGMPTTKAPPPFEDPNTTVRVVMRREALVRPPQACRAAVSAGNGIRLFVCRSFGKGRNDVNQESRVVC